MAWHGRPEASRSRTCSSDERTRLADWEHTSTHWPQEMHRAGSMSACPARTTMALVGQLRTQE
jgi:hypothetical protein